MSTIGTKRPFFAALVGLLTIGLAVGMAQVGGNASDTPSPTEDGDGRAMMLVYSNNNVGYIDVCGCKKKKVRQGSVTRRASLFHRLRAKGHELLVLDGGNSLFNAQKDRIAEEHAKPQILEKAKVLVESYNRMGYQAMAVGHGEFTLGIDALLELRKMAKFPFLSANLTSEKLGGKLLFDPTVEVEVNGVKVGILGLTLVSIPQPYLDKDAPGWGLRVSDPIAAAQKYVPILRARNDLVVVMSQNEVETNQRLAQEVAGIDLIIDPFIKLGAYQKWIRDEKELRLQIKDVHLVRTDAQGAKVGTLDLRVFPKGTPLLDDDIASEIPEGRSHFKFQRISIEPHLLDDPDIQMLVDRFREGTKFVPTELLPPMPHKDKYLTQATCQACHTRQHDFWSGTKHAHAFKSLEDTNDQWRLDCIGCHVVGYGQAFVAPADAEPYKNVQCESCHGLNPEHPSDPSAHKWTRINEKTCLTCHNEDQTRSKFNFPVERRKVACPKMTSSEKKALLGK